MLRIDLAVYNRFKQLVLTVEVKKKEGVSGEWAAEYRRNIMAHGSYPFAPFFLLVTSDKFFLWTKENNTLEETQPDYSVSSVEYLQPYFEEFGFNLTQINEYEFEQVVARWLKNELLYPVENRQHQGWLKESGLAEAVLDGDFYFEKAA